MDNTVIAIRQRNYLELRKRHREEEGSSFPERGSMTRFATKVDLTPRYLSHIHNGRKQIGHAVARKMEAAFGLPNGWLDVDHASGSLTMDPAAREFSALAMRLYLNDPEGVKQALSRYMESKIIKEPLASVSPPRSKPAPLPEKKTPPPPKKKTASKS
jgi:hypothetical protein